LTIPKKDLPKPEIENCCNQHDICYDTCKNGKIGCDNTFRSCMMNACGSGFSASVLKCKAYAEGLYLAVDNLGCPAYIKAQSNACICKSWIG
jgi:secretory phospholipase A2